jgi:CheY-like chemotaxis protein
MTVSPASERQPVILIVDDVPANLKTLSEIMRQGGYKTRPAQSGEQALKAARPTPRLDPARYSHARDGWL